MEDTGAADTASASAVVAVATSAAPSAKVSDPYSEFFQDFSSSVVTVAYAAQDSGQTFYGTGFIFVSEPEYTLVYSNNPMLRSRCKTMDKYHVFFDAKTKIEACILECEGFQVLLVRDDKDRTPVKFCVEPVGHEEIMIIAAMGGAQLHVNTPAIHALLGIVGDYHGDVTTYSCAARDANGIALKGSERYFRVGCSVLDQTMTVDNVDKMHTKKHRTAHRVASAPVFRLTTGEVVGIVYSTSDWCDIKKGLHTKDVLAELVGRFKSYAPESTKWEDGAKKWAEMRMRRRG